jgi:hypothetical protein
MTAVGVDHRQRHYAVALDLLGQRFGELSFTASAGGYAELQRWAETLSEDPQRPVFGIEGAEAGAHGSASTCSVPAIASSRASVRVDPSDAPASPTHRDARRGQVRARRREHLDATQPRDPVGSARPAGRSTLHCRRAHACGSTSSGG